MEFIKKISVPFPGLKEQAAINEALDTISDNINYEANLKDKYLKKKSGLMHDLLTGKVEVSAQSAELVSD